MVISIGFFTREKSAARGNHTLHGIWKKKTNCSFHRSEAGQTGAADGDYRKI